MRAVDATEGGPIVERHLVPFGCDWRIEPGMTGHILVEGATGMDVDDLKASADAGHRYPDVVRGVQHSALVFVAQRFWGEGVSR